MNTRDWALTAFTILAQMSVGSFVVLGVVHFFASRNTNLKEADRLSDRALLAIGPVLVLGILTSLLHLGNPLNAPRAITNTGSSWLSLEILLVITFMVLGAVFAFMQWRKIGTPVLRNTIAVINALIGLALVYAMSRVYMLVTIPAWNTVATPILFYSTTFLLGAAAMGAAFVINFALLHRQQKTEDEVQLRLLRDSLRGMALVSVALLGLEFVVIPLWIAYLVSAGGAAAVSATLLTQENGWVFLIRLLLGFFGAGVISLFIYQIAANRGRVQLLGNLAYLAFVLVLVAELLGRYLFYASMSRVGI